MGIELFIYIIIVASAVFHEYSHAFAARALGDDTAQQMGRLTLNPLKHMELFGTIIIPLASLFLGGTFIGWAKPVPYNPYNLRDKKYGNLKVAIAGPAANICIALLIGIFIRCIYYFNIVSFAGAIEFLYFIVYVNIFLALFNLIPVPPLDGSKVLSDLFPRIHSVFNQIGFAGIFIALMVSFYILSPIAQFIFKLIVGTSF